MEAITTKSKWNSKSFVKAFVDGTLGIKRREGNYTVKHFDGIQTLEYTAHGDDGGTEILAIKLKSVDILSNANLLKFAGTRMAWGRRTRNWGQSSIQADLEKFGAIAVPFSVFSAASLDILSAEIVEKSPSEEVSLKIPQGTYVAELGHSKGGLVRRHFVGACLLKVGDSYFLFDIDRGEIEHGLFNPFIVKLAGPVSSVADAYQSLVPLKVKEAIAEGKTVHRQGEWFFIPAFDVLPDDLPKPSPELIDKATRAPHVLNFNGSPEGNYHAGQGLHYTFANPQDEQDYDAARDEWLIANRTLASSSPAQGELRAGNNRPNSVERFITYQGRTLVSGLIKHTGREHADLNLGSAWFEALPNTAISSWQVSGEID